MTPVKKRVSSFLTLTTLVLVSAGILFAFYYFHVLENQDYQDRLHFRELNRVSNSVSSTVAQISALYDNPIEITYETEKGLSQPINCDNFLKRAKRTERFSRLSQSDFSADEIEANPLHFRFYTDRYTRFNYPECEKAFEFPTADALPQNLNQFPLVFFVKKGGQILARRNYNNSNVDLTDISVSSLDDLLCEAKLAYKTEPGNEELAECRAPENKNENRGPGVSTLLTTEIRGNTFQAYIQPVKILADDEDEGKYVIGLVPAAEANMERLAVSPSSIRVLVILFIILIALLPLLKIRFVNSRYGFRNRDVSQAGFGLLIAVGMITVGIYDQLFYSYFLQHKSEQAKHIYHKINQDFNVEVKELLKIAHRFQNAIAKDAKDEKVGLETLITCGDEASSSSIFNEDGLVESGKYPSDYVLPCLIKRDAVYPKFSDNTAYIRSIFVLNSKGLISTQYPGMFLKESDIYTRRFDLSHRDYFKAASSCQVWQMTDGKCSDGFYIQSIRNVEDGVKSTQFSIPLFEAKQDFTQMNGTQLDGKKDILIFNTLMTSLTHQALPRNFGFAVLNRSGDVLYHSDPNKSLAENFFIETDSVEEILLQAEFADLNRNPVKIRSKYEGTKYTMQVGPIGVGEYQDIPWNLVVFYNEHEADINNMLLVFVASIILILFLVPLYLFARYMVKQRFWAEVFYFNKQKTHLYPILACLMFVTCLLFLFSINSLEYLSFRFAFWLSVIGFLCWLLQWCFRVDLSMHSWLKSPSYVCIIFAVICLLAAILFRNQFLPPFYFNYLVFGVCLIAFFVIAKMTLNKAENLSYIVYENKLVSDKKPYPYSYVLYFFGAVCVAGIGLAAFITNSANSYLLQRQAELESYAWQELITKVTQQQEAYLNEMEVPYAQQRNVSTSKKHIQRTFPDVNLLGGVAQNPANVSEFLTACQVDSVAELGGANIYTDEVINHIFRSLRLNEPFSARLGFLARMNKRDDGSSGECTDGKKNSGNMAYAFHYRPDKFLFSAIQSFFWELALAIVLLVSIFLLLFERLIIQRLLGQHLIDQFMSSKLGSKPSLTNVLSTENSVPCQRKLLMNFSKEEIKQHIAQDKHWFANRIIHVKECIEERNGKFSLSMSLLDEASTTVTAIVIEGFEEIAVNKTDRLKALNALREICSFNWLSVYILSDTAPVYRLIKMSEYTLTPQEQVNTDEQVSWSKLFAQFEKVYGWKAVQKQALKDTRNIFDVVDYESEGWRELAKVKDQFFHFNNVDPDTPSDKVSIAYEWEPEQVVEFFLAQAGAFYRKQWELCTLGEKLALYQLADGAKINPERDDLIEHLQRRGYIYRDKGWHIINDSFKKFILQAESEKVFSEWTNQVESSVWQYLRVPLFTVLIVVGGIVIYSSGQAIDSILAILTATLSLIPLLLKSIHLIKTGYSGGSE